MSVVIGPTTWWLRSKEAADYYARICPLGTILGDGSAVYRRAGGQAWIVAPAYTQIGDQWASGCWNNTLIVGGGNSLCCISSWPNVCNRLICCGFNPCDWFIPDQNILFTAYNNRAFWDTYSSTIYWSSSESNAAGACSLSFTNGIQSSLGKTNAWCVRSVRCVFL
jgi:hypothetical protein